MSDDAMHGSDNLNANMPTPLPTPAQIHSIVDKMFLQYKDAEPVLAKFINYMHQIPGVLAAFEETIHQRTERKKILTMTSDEFIDQFLSDSAHNYFYNSTIDLFFEYNNINYSKIEEDDIVYAALTTLQDYPELKPWKYKIKNQIIKRIKERELLNSIPESCTIQAVIGMIYPSIFTSRDAAKHFLTVLGDILNKKNTNFYFISVRAKHFIQELTLQCCTLFGIPSLTNVFKFKFYDHTFSECRLLNVNEVGVRAIKLNEYASPFKRHIVDMMCVSSHYSKRFGGADAFLESAHCKDASLATHCFYLKMNDELSIINKFVTTTTEPCDNYNISWKKMQYLWKLFLDEEKLPYVIFTNQLKAHLSSRLPCKMIGDTPEDDATGAGAAGSDIVFTRITSKHLPIVSDFLTFWKETITVIGDGCNEGNEGCQEDELEIDELTILFIHYTRTRKPSQKNVNNLNITDQLIYGLVKHFFSDVQIENDKYVMNVTSKMWNKKKEIRHALLLSSSMSMAQPLPGGSAYPSSVNLSPHLPLQLPLLDDAEPVTDVAQHQSQIPSPHAIYNAYERYCAHSYSHKLFVVSKRYFEKYYDEIMK
jgi:hypothetical protein